MTMTEFPRLRTRWALFAPDCRVRDTARGLLWEHNKAERIIPARMELCEERGSPNEAARH